MTDLNLTVGTVTDGSGVINHTFVNPTNANDGNDATLAFTGSYAGPPGVAYLESDLGDQYWVLSHTLIADYECAGDPTAGGIEIECSEDGITWESVATTIAWTPGTPGSGTWTHDDLHKRYWRIVAIQPTNGFNCGTEVYKWAINEGTAPVEPEPEEPPPYEPGEPGRAIVEIYVTDPDGFRWDEAQWDEATWSEDGWVSISEWVIFADVTWGTDRPDAGILADQKAGQWVIQTHDPDRVLDPANEESQFYPLLVPDLPIRVNHGTMRTVRTGIVTDVMYSHAEEGGRISATDQVSRASRAQVPPGTALGDTFIERIEDSIAAAGIQLWVSVRNGWIMEHDLAPDDPDERKSVWTRISEAARELLAVPWVDRDGHIRVTAWDDDTDRGLTIDSSVMVDLQPWVSHDGLYSVVRALDEDGVTIAESRVTPLPAYGERVYDRSEPTIDSESWTARVLADRAGAVLRYKPGTIVPHLAADNNVLIDMQTMDIITLSFPEAVPPIEVRARVLGARVRVTDRTKKLPTVLTRWEWTLLTTIVPNDPLISDNDASIRYLLSDEDGVTFLYPG